MERLQQEKEEAEVARTTKGEFREHARRRSAEQELLRQQMKLQVAPLCRAHRTDTQATACTRRAPL